LTVTSLSPVASFSIRATTSGAIGRRVAPWAHHDDVSVADAGVDHALAVDGQGVRVVAAGDLGADGQVLLDVLDRQDRRARSDAADQGEVNDVALPTTPLRVDNFHRSRLRRITGDIAARLQRVEVVLYRRR